MAKFKLIMKLIANDSALKKFVDTLNRRNAMADEVKQASETLFFHFYGTKAENPTLKAFHYT